MNGVPSGDQRARLGRNACTHRVMEGLQASQPSPENGVIAVRDLRNRGMRVVTRASILYVKAQGDYVRVYADSGRYRLRSTLARVAESFARDGFVRVHRQYVVNLARATAVQISASGTALIRFENGEEIPVARRQVAELRRRLHA